MGVPDLYWFIFDRYSIFTIHQLPQIWRIASNFLVTGPKFGMIMDPYFVFTYASNLEQTASRFSQPGDFFVYLVFVCTIIVVSSSLRSSYIAQTSYYLPVQYTMTVTVPGNEGDCPCTALRPSFAICQRAFCGVQAWWDTSFERTVGLETCGLMVVSGPYIIFHTFWCVFKVT